MGILALGEQPVHNLHLAPILGDAVGSVAKQRAVPVGNDSRFPFRCPRHPLLGVICKFRFQILLIPLIQQLLHTLTAFFSVW